MLPGKFERTPPHPIFNFIVLEINPHYIFQGIGGAKDKMMLTVLDHLVTTGQREGKRKGSERDVIGCLLGVRYFPIYYATHQGLGTVLLITHLQMKCGKQRAREVNEFAYSHGL